MIIDNKECQDKECPDCNGSGFSKGSNEDARGQANFIIQRIESLIEWETFLERCEACNGDGHVEV